MDYQNNDEMNEMENTQTEFKTNEELANEKISLKRNVEAGKTVLKIIKKERRKDARRIITGCVGIIILGAVALGFIQLLGLAVIALAIILSIAGIEARYSFWKKKRTKMEISIEADTLAISEIEKEEAMRQEAEAC